MWFSNALIFEYENSENLDLNNELKCESLKPCPPHARFIYGFTPVINDDLALEVAGSSLIKFAKEERILPRGVILKILEERVKTWEQHQNRVMKRADKAQLAEELEFELLPKSFTLEKYLTACVDHKRKRLIINTASVTQALQLIASLRKAMPGIKISTLGYDENLTHKFSEWILNPLTLPQNFELAQDCLLIALDNEKKKCNFKGYDLPSDEISNLLEKGMVPAEIPLIWNERIQFILTNNFTLKRIKCLDYLLEDINETRQLEDEIQQMEASLTLLTAEFGTLVDELLKAVAKPKTIISSQTQEVVEA